MLFHLQTSYMVLEYNPQINIKAKGQGKNIP